MSTPFTQARDELASLISARPALANVPVFVERDGEDFDESFEAAIGKKGLAIVILEEDAAVRDQSTAGHAAVLNLIVPVAILDNVEVNLRGEEGLRIPSGQVLHETIIGIMGKEVSGGEVSLGQQAFARVGETGGILERYLTVIVPVFVGGS